MYYIMNDTTTLVLLLRLAMMVIELLLLLLLLLQLLLLLYEHLLLDYCVLLLMLMAFSLIPAVLPRIYIGVGRLLRTGCIPVFFFSNCFTFVILNIDMILFTQNLFVVSKWFFLFL